MNLLSCSSNNHCPLSSKVLASAGSHSKILKSSFSFSHLGWSQRRDKQLNYRKASRTLAYYGLQSPPYKLDSLEPYMSKRTLEVHWGAHHRGYVEALNKQLAKNSIIRVMYNNGNPLPEFNNAAQDDDIVLCMSMITKKRAPHQ